MPPSTIDENIGQEAEAFYQRAFDAYKQMHSADDKAANAFATVAVGAKYMRSMRIPKDAANYDPYGAGEGQGCATCWWYEYGDCRIVDGEIYPTGKSDFFLMADTVEEKIEEAAGSKEKETGPKSILTRVKELFTPNTSAFDMGFGFKMLDDEYFVATYTNPYEDEEGEIFSEASIDADLEFMQKTGYYPELWHSHIEGTKHGESIWAGKMGRFAVAIGKFDNTPIAEDFKKYYKTLDEVAVSHGYLYSKASRRDGVYNFFHTFEISTTEPRRAANKHAALILGGKEMSEKVGLTEQGRKRLSKILSEDVLDQLIQFHEAKSEELDNAGVARKEMDESIEEETPEETPQTETAENAAPEAGESEVSVESAGKEMPEWASALVQSQKETSETLNAVAELLAALTVNQGQKVSQEPEKPRRVKNPAIDDIREEASRAFADGTKNITEIDPVTGLFTGLGIGNQPE